MKFAPFKLDLRDTCRYFAELSPHPMFAVEGATYVVCDVNPAFLRLAGLRRTDVVGRLFAEVFCQQAADGCMAAIDRVFRTGTSESLLEQKRCDDPPAYWSYTVWPILDGDERPEGVMVQVTDSTEIAIYRQQAAAANEALLIASVRQQELTEASEALNARLQTVIAEKEYFIAVLSHELRTPLTPVLMATSLLHEDKRIEDDTRSIIDMIHRNVTVEARLIDDLLDMTRLDRGKLNLDLHPVDLRELIESAAEACRPDLEASQVALNLEPSTGAVMAEADASRMTQVFSNLLRNSAKFTRPGGSVTIRYHADGRQCTVEVIDSGVGMDAEFVPHAFSAFEQADKSTGRKGGLGLGLAICKTIVELHGGSITAHSEGKGCGATFTVRLPCLAVEQSAAAPKSDQPILHANGSLPVKPLRILLVEDHADTARIMRRLLMGDGHAVKWAANVAAGVDLATTNDFDLLLSDLGLPDGTGVDLMRALRREGSTLPGIVLSGYGQNHDVARSLEAGFAAHLVKPLNLSHLRDTIATLIS